MYYRLTYTATSNRKKLGDSILNGRAPLSIGQGISCDVQLSESERYEPQLYAYILPCEDGNGWYIVRRTDFYDIFVNGIEMSIAQRLNNGDLLLFSDGDIQTVLKYEMFDHGELDTTNGIVYKKHKSYKYHNVFAFTLALLIIGLLGYILKNQSQKDLHNYGLLNHFSQSIYHITTDSVYLLCDTLIDGQYKQIVIDSIELDRVAAGTAFLTEDSLFITARHCVEPWINDEEWDGVTTMSKMSSELRLAIKAETENRLAGYEKYVLRAHSVISKGFERYDYSSTDFCMNKSRDMVVRLGTAKEVIYWRTIFPIASRRDMELGDFAYIKVGKLTDNAKKSEISMAEWEDIVTFAKSGNQDVAVIGYPLNDNGADLASLTFGNLMGLEYNENQKTPTGCLQMSANINAGNSGGPIFAKIGNEIKVIGIVSKTDGHAKEGMFWAVPITEVLNMHAHGDYVKKDSVTYRR